MRKYLATLHKRPHHHKKRFALLTSASFTLLIFSIWALVNFGVDKESAVQANSAAVGEASPFGSLWRGLGASIEALRGNVSDLKTGLEVVDFEASYKEMKSNSLNTNGR